MPSSTLDVLAETYSRVSEANRQRLTHLTDLLADLSVLGIEVMLLKGADLLTRVYRTQGTRPLADIDLLVHECDLPAIDRLLRSRGFTPLIDGNPAYASSTSGLILDLSTSLWYLNEIELTALWARAERRTFGQTTARVMSMEDLLIHLTAYAVVHRGHLSAAFLQDLTLLTKKSILDWNRVVGFAREWHLTIPLFHGFSVARETKPDMAIPQSVFDHLAPRRWTESCLLWCLRRLVNGVPIPELGHALLLLTQRPGRRLDRLRATLSPPSAFLAYRYGAGAHAHPLRTRLFRLLHLARSGTILAFHMSGRLLGLGGGTS